jgi:lipid A 3-O-deacylase
LKLTWSSDLTSADTASRPVAKLSKPLFEWLPLIRDPRLDNRAISISIGQSIYTPSNTQISYRMPHDRPYAGYLYAEIGLIANNQRRLTIWELDFGVVGPLAMGEEVQNTTHDWLAIKSAKGWDHQLDNEPTLGILSETKWQLWHWESLGGFGASLISHLGGRLGNVAIYANGGGEFHFGWRLQTNFGSCPIRPGCDFNDVVDINQTVSISSHPLSIFMFATVDGRWVIRDIFLDGNTGSGGIGLEKEPLVGDFMLGVVFSYKRFRASYGYVLRTKQFKEQDGNQLFGAFTFGWVF